MKQFPRLIKDSSRRRLFISSFVACVLFAGLVQTSAQPTLSNTATFLVFEINEAQPQPKVTLSEQRVVKGEFKTPALEHAHAHDAGMLVVKVEDASGKPTYETHLHNPLDQHLEYVNDRGELDRARVQQSSGNFEVRVPFDIAGQTIYVYVVDENHRLNLLFTQKPSVKP